MRRDDTLMGSVPSRRITPLPWGLGMHGTFMPTWRYGCDLLVGWAPVRRFGLPARFLHSAPRKIIHVDVDPTSIRRNVRVDLPRRFGAGCAGKTRLGILQSVRKPSMASEKPSNPWQA